MKILVTGATGFIGLETVAEVLRAGHEVRAMVRRPSRAALVHPFDAEVVAGDLRSPASLARAVDGVDAVIHLAGRATFESYDRIAPTLVDGTRDLAIAARDAGVRKLVFGSSAFVYRGDGVVVDGGTPADPVLDYGHAKIDAEAAMTAAAADSRLGVVNLRLPHVYGPHSLLFGLVRRRLVPFPGAGENRMAQLHVYDAARALVAAASSGWCGTAPIADRSGSDGPTPTWNEYFDTLRRFAPDVRVISIPAGLARAGAAVVGPLLGRFVPTMVAGDTIRGWNLDLPIDAAATWSALGLEPRYATVEDGVPATLDGAVAFRWRHPILDWR